MTTYCGAMLAVGGMYLSGRYCSESYKQCEDCERKDRKPRGEQKPHAAACALTDFAIETRKRFPRGGAPAEWCDQCPGCSCGIGDTEGRLMTDAELVDALLAENAALSAELSCTCNRRVDLVTGEAAGDCRALEEEKARGLNLAAAYGRLLGAVRDIAPPVLATAIIGAAAAPKASSKPPPQEPSR